MGIIPCPNVDSKQLYDEIFSDENLAKKTASRMEMAKELSNSYREYIFKRYEEYFRDKGVEIVYFPYTQSTSSTQIRKTVMLKTKDIKLDNE